MWDSKGLSTVDGGVDGVAGVVEGVEVFDAVPERGASIAFAAFVEDVAAFVRGAEGVWSRVDCSAVAAQRDWSVRMRGEVRSMRAFEDARRICVDGVAWARSVWA